MCPDRGHEQHKRREIMPVRLVITTYAKPGKGAELAHAMAERCRAVQQEPGCQQFEVFQSALDPDKLVTLELWDDQAALDVHAQVNTTRPPNPALAALRAEDTRPREDYTYNRTR
jgi:quinol monooxygenase YgiN